jgi:hypothetical protein
MHERTRRNLCRLAFLALGVLPMIGTLAWAGYRVSPLYAAVERSSWEQRLRELTGLLATIERVEHPAGGTVLLTNVHLADPDGGDEVAKIRQTEISQQPQGIVVLLSQPEVVQGKFLRLWDSLHVRVLQGPLPVQAIQVTTGELTLEVGSRAQTFKTVRCTVEPRESSVHAWLEFQLAGLETPSPAQIHIERNRRASPPVTRWTLQSNAPLPCDIFADYVPCLSRFGDRAYFQGKLSVSMNRAEWSGDLVGRFSQVDLDQLTDSLPHKLSGLATVSIDRALVDRGAIYSADGNVVCPGGTVSLSLVSSLAQHLPLVTPEIMLATHAPLSSYDRLAFRFSISGEGCSLAGWDDQSGEVILIANGRPLLTCDSRERYPLVSLVRALTPDSQFLVPATDETKSLLMLFPFPSPRPPTQPRVRLSDRGS